MEGWNEALEERLRRRVLAAFHRGVVAPGDRLPGIRRLAQETGQDHRAVSRAYRRLQEEGLVEIRPRSGVYLAGPTGLVEGQPVLSETASWLARILYEAWQRDLSPLDLSNALASTARPRPLRVVCVESVRDPLEVIASEVEGVLGASCRRLLVSGEHGAPDPTDLVEEGDPVDLVVTTAYHTEAQRAAEEEGIAVALFRINPEWVGELRRLAGEGLVVLVDDPRTTERFQTLLGAGVQVRAHTLEDARRRAPPPASLVYATALARPSVPPRWARRLVVPGVPLLDPGTVRELLGILVRARIAS